MGIRDLPDGSEVERDAERATRPRALIHKKILDVAKSNPDASTVEIASKVSGASKAFVERVLEEYGESTERDPGPDTRKADGAGDVAEEASDDEAVSIEAGDGDEAEDDAVRDPEELTEKQRETLIAVAERPTATQEEIADILGVSRATVSKRLNSVEGFEWPARQQFVRRMFDYRGGGMNEHPQASREPAVDETSLATLTRRVDDLETQLQSSGETSTTNLDDPELVHKLVHACMDAEYISQDEELRILEEVLSTTAE